MKKTLFLFIATLASALSASIGMDQFTQISFPAQQVYGKALQICQEKEFSHFLIKKISYSDDKGQTLEFKGMEGAEQGTLISDAFSQDMGAPLGNLKVDFELICFKEAPKEILAVDVQDVFNFLAQMQNQVQQPEITVQGSNVLEVKTMAELSDVLAKAKGTIYLDCYSSMCPPCKKLAPKFDQYSKEFAAKGIFLKINVDEVPEFATEYKISSIPTLIVFKDQKEVERQKSLPSILKYFDELK